MAIKPLNSVAGFSVGETPSTVILANGDITTTNITTTGRSNLNAIGNIFISGGTNGQVIKTDGAGNLSFVSVDSAALNNGTSNVRVFDSANVTISSAGNANVLIITGTGINVAGTLNATGNANVGNLGTGGLITATGNVSGGNLTTGGVLSVTGNANVGNLGTSGLVVATGNVTGGNLTTGGVVTATGNVTGGNLTTGGVVAATGNVSGGNLTTGGALSVTGNANVGNIGAVTAVFTGNVSSLNANLGNLAIANYLQGTLTTAAQPNITSVGTLTSLSVTGNIAGGNLTTGGALSVTGNANVGNIGAVTAVFTGNVSSLNANLGNLAIANYIQGTLTTAAQPNITSVGTLSSLDVSGNISGGNISTTGTLSSTGNANVGNLGTSGLITATGNVSGGNLTTGGVVAATGNVSGGNLTTGGVVAATGNVSGANFITAGNVFAPAIVQNASTYDTRISLSSVAGIIEANTNGNATQFLPGGSVRLSAAGSSQIIGGTFDGSGITLGASQTDLYQNRGGNVTVQVGSGGTIANTWTFAQDGSFTSPGNITTTANANVGNLNTGGVVTATGNITGGNLNTAGQVVATANVVTSGNLVTDYISGKTGSINITAVGTNSSINLLGTGSGTINVGNFNISNVGGPTEAKDAATKEYVDNAVSASLSIHQAVRVETPTALNATYTQGGTTPTITDISTGNTLTTSSTHNLSIDDMIVFTNSFNGITAGTAYFVYSVPSSTQITVSATYHGSQVTGLTNGTGLTQASRANSGVGAKLTNAGSNAAISIDDVSLSLTNRVLVYRQANAAHNGIYTVTVVGDGSTAWELTRATDADKYGPNSPDTLGAGDYFFVQAGSAGAGESYVLSTPGVLIIGTTGIQYSQFSDTQVYTAGTGLSLVGTQFSIANTLVTASSYGNGDSVATFTVNSQGQLTAASNVTITANAANLTGTTLNSSIVTSSLTSVGTLGSLSVTGNATAGNLTTLGTANVGTLAVTGTSNLGPVSNVTITGGTSGQYLKTNGSGVLSFGTVDTDTLANGTSNVDIPVANGNVLIAVGGTPNVAVFTSTGVNVAGTLNAVGNANVGNLGTGGAIAATGNISGGNIAAATNVTVGNTTITWANVTTTAITANQTISSVSVAGTTGIEFLVKAVDSAGAKYSVATVQAVTDGTNVDYATFGTVQLGGYTGSLAVNIVGGFLRLQVTPASSNSTVWTTQYRLI